MTETSRQQLTFDQPGIGSILRSYRLRVPINQREYSWEEKHVKTLFQDINAAIFDNAPEYFLGTIVAIPRGPDDLEIVDGQQRLATTAMLFAAMRDHLKTSPDDKVIVDDLERLLSFADRQARRNVPRLVLNVTDNQYFQSRIAPEPLEDTTPVRRPISHRLIDQAIALAHEHVANILSSHAPRTHGDILNRWITYLEHHTIVILMKVPAAGNAFRLFETLNDRGLKASQADLVKNYLFGKSEDRKAEAQQKWASMRAVIESVDDDPDITITYLRQMLISLYGYLRESQVYETIQQQAKGVDSTLQLLSELELGAVDFSAIQNPEHDKWNPYPSSVRRAIRTLLLLKIKPMRPLLLAVARRFNHQETDKTYGLLINVAVRLLIAGGARSGSFEKAVADSAVAVTSREISQANEVLEILTEITPGDNDFRAAFARAEVISAAHARYYLRSLEMRNNREEFPSYEPNDDPMVINLEHVLPRSPEGNWPQFDDADAASAYRRIGNMVLLPADDNRAIGSEPFQKKRDYYARSPFALTKHVAEAEGWTLSEIDERQNGLADLAVETWPLRLS